MNESQTMRSIRSARDGELLKVGDYDGDKNQKNLYIRNIDVSLTKRKVEEALRLVAVENQEDITVGIPRKRANNRKCADNNNI